MPPVRNRKRAAGAVKFIAAARLVLGFPEIRQHVVKTPAAVAVLAPAIVILMLATDVQQTVDRTRSAQNLAARLKHPSPIQARLGFGLVHPVDVFVFEQPAIAERHVNPDVAVLRASLEQQHRIFAVRAQTVGQHASGRPRAHDDVVEFDRAVIGMHQRLTHVQRRENLVAREGHATTSLLAVKSNEFNSLIATGKRI
jgi:hypothetical protein